MTQKEQAMFQEAQKYLIVGCVASGRFNPVYGQPMYLSRAMQHQSITQRMRLDHHLPILPLRSAQPP